VTAKLVAAWFQFLAQAGKIVDFAVEDDDVALAMREHRLMPGGTQIDYC